MSLAEKILELQNLTLTENGAVALNNTGNDLVNLFSVIGGLRNRNEEEIADLFFKALVEDKLLATRIAFYSRDAREGLGERRSGRIFFKVLAECYPEIMAKNLALLPEYGRWDDLICLFDFLPEKVTSIIKEQLYADLSNMKDNKSVSLLAKWMPSVNTSNIETVIMAKKLANALKMSQQQYRKMLSSLRKYLNIVETNLTFKTYDQIIYSDVPSIAMNRYYGAFERNDKERYNEYLSNVSQGKETINSDVLYPYDIVEKVLYRNDKSLSLQLQWDNLPDYVDKDRNCLIMSDVSGSMYGRPMATSIGLALYFAQRNKGIFANKFMTFSSAPKLIEIKGKSLFEQIRYIESSEWGMSTNIEAAFQLLLNAAVTEKCKQDEMPSSIIVITDMEFNQCCQNRDWLFYDNMADRFKKAGYTIPQIVFWNVNSHKNTYQASYDKKGVILASGQSSSVFKSLVENIELTPYDYMLSILNSKRYAAISI